MTELTTTDLRFVVGRIPSDIRLLLKENAGVLFVAGGFVRAVVAGRPMLLRLSASPSSCSVDAKPKASAARCTIPTTRSP